MEPKRRIVRRDTLIDMSESDNPSVPDENKPMVRVPVSERQRLERLIRLTDMALNPFEDRVERGISLTAEEQRLMSLHQNTLMRLEAQKSALEMKHAWGKKTNVGLAKYLREKGMDDEYIRNVFGGSRDIEAFLAGVLTEEAEDDSV